MGRTKGVSETGGYQKFRSSSERGNEVDINSVDVGRARVVENEPMGG